MQTLIIAEIGPTHEYEVALPIAVLPAVTLQPLFILRTCPVSTVSGGLC